MVTGRYDLYSKRAIIEEAMNNKLKHHASCIALCVAFIALICFLPKAGFAACSPGIPCTGYDLNAPPTGTDYATDPNYNGPKTGEKSPYATGSCDGNFMDQIYGKAYLEASRDMIMSEQIIRKPDSVLEYSCFDQLIAKTFHQAGPIFSNNTADYTSRGFAFKTGDEDGSVSAEKPTCTAGPCDTYTVSFLAPRYGLDNNLFDVIITPLKEYITKNFGHTYLGGASSIDSHMNFTNIGPDSYICSEMSTVWEMAQCTDFGEDDRFRSFDDLVHEDPRAFPQACSPANIANDSDNKVDTNSPPLLFDAPISLACPISCPNAASAAHSHSSCGDSSTTGNAKTGVTNTQIELANNCKYTYASFDVIKPYFNLVKSPVVTTAPTAQDAAKKLFGHPTLCSAPIPTGVIVLSYTHAPSASSVNVNRFVHYDHVCPNPGCYYVPVKQPLPILPGSPFDVNKIIALPPIATGVCAPM